MVELQQQLDNAEEYNNNLHEEVHQLHNRLHPYFPPGAAEMELGALIADDEDMEVEEPEEPMQVDDSDDEGGNNSGMDSDHEE